VGTAAIGCSPSEARLLFSGGLWLCGPPKLSMVLRVLSSFKSCHPSRSEGPMHPAGTIGGADESIVPSARTNRGPQDDKK
jgi:hypothetical protein